MKTRWAVPAVAVCGAAIIGVCSVPLARWARAGGGLPVGAFGTSYANRAFIAAAFVPYVVALVVARLRAVPAWLPWAVAALAAAVLIVPAPLGSQDVFSYVFYGKMTLDGVNPMQFAPLKMSGHPWFSHVLWRDQPSVYGPVWIYVCAAAALSPALWGAVLTMKVVAVAGVAAGTWCVARMAESATDRAWRTIACLWNPLVLFSTANTGHVDGALFGLIAAALLARKRERPWLATLALAAASLVKVYCLVFLALLLIEVVYRHGLKASVRLAAGALGAAVVCYAPLWAGRATFNGLATISGEFSHTLAAEIRGSIRDRLIARDGAARALSVATTATRAIVATAMVGAFAWLAVRLRRARDATSVWGWAFAAYLLLSPWLLPWYDLPLIAIAMAQPAPASSGAPLVAAALAFSLTSLTTAPFNRYALPAVAALAAWGIARYSARVRSITSAARS